MTLRTEQSSLKWTLNDWRRYVGVIAVYSTVSNKMLIETGGLFPVGGSMMGGKITP